MSDPEVRPEDALQVAQRALSRCNEFEERLEAVESEKADLVDRLAALELKYQELDEGRPYDALTRDEKIGMVREKAFRMAIESTGFAKLDYNDIMWTVFDGEPGTKHCYQLMKWAAEARGFEHKTPANGNEHLAVNAAEAKRGLAFCSENKATSKGGF